MQQKYLLMSVLCFFFYSNSYANSEDYTLLEANVRTNTGKIEELEQKFNEMQKEINSLKEVLAKKADEEEERKNYEFVMSKSPEEVIKIASESIDDNDTEKARKILRYSISKKPNDVYRGMMEFYIGESFFKEKDYKQAAYEYMNSYKTNKNGKKTAETLYRLALCFDKLSKKDEAIQTLDKIIAGYPSSGEILEKAKRLRSSLVKVKNASSNR